MAATLSDYEKDHLSAMAKYSDSVYQLEQLKGNGQFYQNVMNLFLVLIALILLHNIGILNASLLYILLFLVSLVSIIYIIVTLHFNEYKRDQSVYSQILFKSS